VDTIHEIGQGANPQAEDGHIDIANEIAEALARINISGYEYRILWALWRKTYGWHKKVDRISVTQFEKMTGLDRRNVARTLSRLIKRKLVVKFDNSFIATYGFQKDYSKWKTVVEIAGGLSKSTTRSVVILNAHKRKTTKEKTLVGHRKKETDPRVKEFLKYWGEIFQQETGSPYTASFGKDGQLIKDLLKIHPLETLKQLTRNFFRDRNVREQVQQGRIGYTIGVFFKEINRLLSLKGMDPLEQAKREIFGKNSAEAGGHERSGSREHFHE